MHGEYCVLWDYALSPRSLPTRYTPGGDPFLRSVYTQTIAHRNTFLSLGLKKPIYQVTRCPEDSAISFLYTRSEVSGRRLGRTSDQRGCMTPPGRAGVRGRVGDTRYVGGYRCSKGNVEVELVVAPNLSYTGRTSFVVSIKWRESSPFDNRNLEGLAESARTLDLQPEPEHLMRSLRWFARWQQR